MPSTFIGRTYNKIVLQLTDANLYLNGDDDSIEIWFKSESKIFKATFPQLNFFVMKIS